MPAPRLSWPAAAVLVVALALASLMYVFKSLRDAPGEAIDKGRAVLQDLEAVAAAFRTGTVTTSFGSYCREIRGVSRLQFAELRQTELFERTDSQTLFWGQLALPDVIVEARAPVEYAYYVDLEKPWRFALEERTVKVTAPPAEFNTPALDVSAIRYVVREGSVFRDEDAVLERLRQGLTELARMRARAQIPLVRETGRRKVEEFVERWLKERFSDGEAHRARVLFGDEAEAPARP
jgi:hypothetical protein